MKKDELASISLKKIIIISIIFILILGVSVLANNVKINNVKIKFANNHEITVVTSKTKVLDILEENHIVLKDNETVKPAINEDITEDNFIQISIIGEEPAVATDVIDVEVNEQQIKEQYTNITEEILVVEEEIPFETITKDVSSGSGNTINRIIQNGRNGIKRVTYKVTYQNAVEISREELSSEIIREPINKIVQVQAKTLTSRGSYSRTSGSSGKSGVYKVTAYCSCAKCCGKTNGITASGAKATSHHTIATPNTFTFGTQVVINGTTYTVEDRGGAIQGNRIDIYMDSHAEALAWGVRYLYVDVLE